MLVQRGCLSVLICAVNDETFLYANNGRAKKRYYICSFVFDNASSKRRALIGVLDLGYYKCLVQARRDSHNLISGVKKDAYLYANAGLALGAKIKNSAVSVLSLVTWGSTPIW